MPVALVEVAAVFGELLLDPRFDVVAKDRQALDVGVGDREAGQVDVVQPRAGEIHVGEFRLGEVDVVEVRSGERTILKAPAVHFFALLNRCAAARSPSSSTASPPGGAPRLFPRATG